MEMVLWILFGAITGWIVSIMAGNKASNEHMSNAIVGVAGALGGGLAGNVLTRQTAQSGLHVASFGMALVGALLFVMLYKAFIRTER